MALCAAVLDAWSGEAVIESFPRGGVTLQWPGGAGGAGGARADAHLPRGPRDADGHAPGFGQSTVGLDGGVGRDGVFPVQPRPRWPDPLPPPPRPPTEDPAPRVRRGRGVRAARPGQAGCEMALRRLRGGGMIRHHGEGDRNRSRCGECAVNPTSPRGVPSRFGAAEVSPGRALEYFVRASGSRELAASDRRQPAESGRAPQRSSCCRGTGAGVDKVLHPARRFGALRAH